MIADVFNVRITNAEGCNLRQDVRLEYHTDDPFALKLYANGTEYEPWHISRECLWTAVRLGVGPIRGGDFEVSVSPRLVVMLLRGQDGATAALHFNRAHLRRYLLRTLDGDVGGVPLGSEGQHYDIDAVIRALVP